MMKKRLAIFFMCVCPQIVSHTSAVFARSNEAAGERTGKVVVNLTRPGSLEELAPDIVWEDKVDTLKITGKLNSYDLRMVRRFCGSDEYGSFYPTTLKQIDLSEVTIVPDDEASKAYYIIAEDMGTAREYYVEKDKPTLLPDKLFYNCCSIESIVLPPYIREIGVGAFFKCVAMKELKMPDEITHIHNTAFGVCNAMEKMVLPSHLTFMGNYLFTYCENLKEVVIPEGVTKLNKRTFEQTPNLKNINLPKSLRELAFEALFGANGLEILEIPEGVVSLPEGCVEACSALKEVSLPSSLVEIGQNAFQDCYRMETVTFKEGLKHIGLYAFKNCRALRNVVLPNSLESIDNEAFINCNEMTNLQFGNGLKTIGEKAFFHNNNIETLVFPETMELIDYAAFAECMGLKKVMLGKGKPNIVGNPFLGCFALQAFEVDADNQKFTVEDGTLYSKDHSMLYAYPNGKESKTFVMHPKTEKTDDFVFWFCKNLEEVEFSPSFNSFGYRAFCGCSNLKKITVKTKEPVENKYTDDVFEEVDHKNCQLIVPEGCRQAYLQSPTWGEFQVVESAASGMEEINADNMTVKDCGAGIEIGNIGADVHTAVLSSLSGQTLSRAAVVHGRAVLPAAALPAGGYIITLHGVSGTHALKMVRR
ncbi:MAG: leucine-rich repeat domain-containing protein [Prevotella sp.]|nr:leucine-rich repeat domain-containing protein [Prevotella sp.]MDY6131270.1 leucine-rich repeat domain-containing protein [Prevotella sp.]